MFVLKRFPCPVFSAEGGAGAPSGDTSAPPSGGAGNEGGSGGASWFASIEGLDADTSAFLTGKNFPDMRTALKSAMEADKLARSRLMLPEADKLGEWDGWEKLGWARDRAAYQVGVPDAVKQKYQDGFDLQMEADFVDFAHQNRMPAPIAQAVLDFYVGHAEKVAATLTEKGAKSQAELDATLKQDWGQSYEGNVELAKRAFGALGLGVDDAAALDKVTGSPGLVKFFHKLATMIGEDRLVAPGAAAAQGAGGKAISTPAEAQAELDRLNTDPEHRKIVMTPGHPKYREANDYRARLAQILSEN